MRYRSGKMQDGLEKRKQNLGAKLQELRMKVHRHQGHGMTAATGESLDTLFLVHTESSSHPCKHSTLWH